MPVTEHLFADFPPRRLYVDTNMLISYLFRSERYYARCVVFFRRLAGTGVTTLYISSLTWMEFAHVVLGQRFRDRLPPAIRQRFHLDRWHERSVREWYFAEYRRALEALLGQFAWDEIALTPEIRAEALALMVEYDLGSQDAVHLASARLAGVRDFASFDRAFRRVDGLHLWNDQIYVGQPI